MSYLFNVNGSRLVSLLGFTLLIGNYILVVNLLFDFISPPDDWPILVFLWCLGVFQYVLNFYVLSQNELQSVLSWLFIASGIVWFFMPFIFTIVGIPGLLIYFFTSFYLYYIDWKKQG
jgi:hypothetical protein